MLAFDTAWSFLKSDVLEKDYEAALRAAQMHGLPAATTSAIRHPRGNLDSQLAPIYSPDFDEEEEEMEDKEAKKERMLRLLAQMQGSRSAM